jgi:hypothetical protein
MDRVNMYASFYVGIRAGGTGPYSIKLPAWSQQYQHHHNGFITTTDNGEEEEEGAAAAAAAEEEDDETKLRRHSTSPVSVLEAAF